jgi:hypothetical protein
VYWFAAQPPDALFQEVFAGQTGRAGGAGEAQCWYALRTVRVDDYARAMKPRSPKWRTVHVPGRAFEAISGPFAPALGGGAGAGWEDHGPVDPALQPLGSSLAPY